MRNRIHISFASLIRVATLAIVMANESLWAAGFVNVQEMRQKDQWVNQQLLGAQAKISFSFIYDGQPSSGLLTAWPKNTQSKKLDNARTQHCITWTDPRTSLQVRCIAVDYHDFPAIEWTVYFKNTGTINTPILKDIQGLDSFFQRGSEGEFVLHGIKGDFCTADSYEPYQLTLGTNAVKEFAPPSYSGKSSDGPDGWPYFNLQLPDGGVILAVGWPGQWASSFTRDASTGLRVKAGQQLTNLYLKPGEEIRTPLIAMLFWQGKDFVSAQNLWRRWYLAYNIPRVNGRCPQPMISTCPSPLAQQTEANCRLVTNMILANDFFSALWVDAGWYPCDEGPYKENDRWLNTGTWLPDSKRLPNGFREFSDKLHARNKKLILWFEPERVGDPNSWLGKHHPDWLLPGQSHGWLLNEGNPDALLWLIDHVDGMIKSEGIDWYREDMNGGGPLDAWRKNDTPDRQGVTENLYVQGHLYFWDELRRRNPGLFIDSCASGGRRNDIETMRRAVPLLRSDFTGMPHFEGAAEGNQGHTYGLSFWLPFQGTGTEFSDKYSFRSFYLPSLNIQITAPQQAHAECTQIAPYILFGDYYPLTPYNRQLDQWIAWQFNRPKEGDGAVQAFRRPKSAVPDMKLMLRGLDSTARYSVKNLDTSDIVEISGKELMEEGLLITLHNQPDSALIVYRQLK